jgi:hypothetical protein
MLGMLPHGNIDVMVVLCFKQLILDPCRLFTIGDISGLHRHAPL